MWTALAIVTLASSLVAAAMAGIRWHQKYSGVDDPEVCDKREWSLSVALLAFVAPEIVVFTLLNTPMWGLTYGALVGMAVVGAAGLVLHQASCAKDWWQVKRLWTVRSLLIGETSRRRPNRQQHPEPVLATTRWLGGSGAKLTRTYAAMILLLAVWQSKWWVALAAVAVERACAWAPRLPWRKLSEIDEHLVKIVIALTWGVVIGESTELLWPQARTVVVPFVAANSVGFFFAAMGAVIATSVGLRFLRDLTAQDRLLEFAPSLSFFAISLGLLICQRAVPQLIPASALATAGTATIAITAYILRGLAGP